jgi:hypothetical protein
MTDNSSENCLTGKSDFVGWLIKVQAQLEEKGYMDEKFCIKSTDTVNYERKAYNFIVNRLSNSIAGKMACEQSGSALLRFLKEHYSTGNAFELKTKYEDFKMMTHHNDAIKYIDTINSLKTKAIQANAKIYPRDEFKKLVNDVNPVFYLDYIRTVRLNYQSKLEEDNLQEKDIAEIRPIEVAPSYTP